MTHLLYAFAGVNNKTGEVYLADESADIQKIYDGDVHDNRTLNMFGNLKQIYLLKKKNRNLKTLLSIGGWSIRTSFPLALGNDRGKRTFANSSVGLLKDLGFDGLDIDWEYPNNTKEAQDLVDTCKYVRQELDAYSHTLTGNPRFLLTLAVPAGPDHYRWFDMPGLAPYVDSVNLMAYDYQGSFSNFSGHDANVFKSHNNPRSTDFDTQTAVDYYLHESGWPAERFTLGMPLYGRSFAKTSGPGQTFTKATDGSWENGVWDYKVLPLTLQHQHGNNSFNSSSSSWTTPTPVYHDETIMASWSYSNVSRYMVTYDTPRVATAKAQYIHELGMGGAMWWELSGDRPLNDSRSLLRAVTQEFATCGGLEQVENVLEYPQSRYKNLRQGMVGQ